MSRAELTQEMVEGLHLRLVDVRRQPVWREHSPVGECTPHHAIENASDEPLFIAAANCPARCHGPSNKSGPSAQPLLELAYQVLSVVVRAVDELAYQVLSVVVLAVDGARS